MTRWAALVLLAACTKQAPLEKPTPVRLPDTHLGTWVMTGSGGGIDGHWDKAEGDPVSITLTAENVAIWRKAGAETARKSFTPRFGNTIFGDAWLIQFEGELEEMVVRVHEDTLSLAQNVYDGGGASYRRDG